MRISGRHAKAWSLAGEPKAGLIYRVLAVFAEEKLQLTFRRPVGRRVAVRGSPFTAHTSHHHAPIVMQVSEIGAR
jgi:hypothetical protein